MVVAFNKILRLTPKQRDALREFTERIEQASREELIEATKSMLVDFMLMYNEAEGLIYRSWDSEKNIKEAEDALHRTDSGGLIEGSYRKLYP